MSRRAPSSLSEMNTNSQGSQNKSINALMFSFSQAKNKIPSTWILLDSQSTIDIFNNPELLQNVCTVDQKMKIQCNAGSRITNMMGDLPGYGPVWYDQKAIANVLCLYNVQKKYHIAYDSGKNHSFIMTKPTRKQFHFLDSGMGLHYLDTMKHKETNQYCTNCDNDESGQVLMLDTVTEK